MKSKEWITELLPAIEEELKKSQSENIEMEAPKPVAKAPAPVPRPVVRAVPAAGATPGPSTAVETEREKAAEDKITLARKLYAQAQALKKAGKQKPSGL